MRLLFVLCVLVYNTSFSQKGSIIANFEPSVRIAENHINDELYFIYGGTYKIGGLLNNKFGLGFTYNQLNVWKNFDNQMLEELDGGSGIGFFFRYHFPWKVKDQRVGFFTEGNLMYRNYQTFRGLPRSDIYKYGNFAATFGFEVNFWKYFYINLGMRGVIFFNGGFYPRARGLIECRIPLNE